MARQLVEDVVAAATVHMPSLLRLPHLSRRILRRREPGDRDVRAGVLATTAAAGCRRGRCVPASTAAAAARLDRKEEKSADEKSHVEGYDKKKAGDKPPP